MQFQKVLKNQINISECAGPLQASCLLHPLPCRLCLGLDHALPGDLGGVKGFDILIKAAKAFILHGNPVAFQNLVKLSSQIVPLHNVIQHTVLQEELRPLEALGKLLSDGLLNHSRACKSDQSSRLSQNQIAQHGKACRHAPRGRVREDGNIEKPRIRMAL